MLRLSFLLATLFLLLPRPAIANAGHWQSIGVSRTDAGIPACAPALASMALDDGLYASFANCSSTAGVELRFLIAGHAPIQDATLSFDARSSIGVTVPRVTCLSAAGPVVAEIVSAVSFSTSGTRQEWDVPLTCLTNPNAVFEITGTDLSNLTADFIKLNVKSEFRNAALLDVASDSGTCGPECDHAMTIDDESHSEWIACSSAFDYSNPTDFVFDTFDHASATRANLVLDTTASGSNARARVTCIDDNGLEIGEIVADRLYPQSAEVTSWPVPQSCFVDDRTTVRVVRTGTNCIGIDQIRLEVDSASRSHSIATAAAGGGSCGDNRAEGCLSDLNRDDNKNLEWLACSSSYAYGSPTDLYFLTPDWAGVTAATLVLDTSSSGSQADVRISCVADNGLEIAEILLPTRFPQIQRNYSYPIPLQCFVADRTQIRLELVGSNCLGVDYARLYTVSDSGVPDGFVVNNLPLQGFPGHESIAPGEFLTLHVHAPLGSFDVEIIRFGATEESLFSEFDIPGSAQAYRADAYKQGARFDPSWSFEVPSSFRSGLYAAKLSDAASEAYVTFVVRDPDPTHAASLAVLASTNTWEAYNSWNGDALEEKSFYRYFPRDESFRTSARFVSNLRPNPLEAPSSPHAGGHLAAAELWILKWLEREDWAYSMVTGIDLEDQSLLQNYRTLLVSTHSEYWTPNMYQGLENFLDAGGNLLYLSGNGIYWRTTRSDQQLEAQKNNATHTHDGQRGGLWRSVGQSEHRLTGVGYTSVGYCTSAPFQVLAADHWLFDGTGVSNGQLIGNDGEPGACGVGASGWETDKVGADTPADHVLLARGTNPDNGGADMLFYERPSGARIFSGSSINFGRSLVRDAALSGMLNNAIARMSLTREQLPVTSISAPDGSCLALGCENVVHTLDGLRLRWAACSAAYDYGDPTDFEFDLGGRNVVHATFRMTTDASGNDARAEIRCIDQAGATLATLQSSRLFPTELTSYSWPLDPACLGGPSVTIRLDREGLNCLGPDFVALDVEVPEPSFAMGLSIGLGCLTLLGVRRRPIERSS